MEEASDRATVQLSELTNKYSEAQRNAQKAMALFKETRDENEVLKSNFEALKQASLLTSRPGPPCQSLAAMSTPSLHYSRVHMSCPC